jgi:hypothetical protein
MIMVLWVGLGIIGAAAVIFALIGLASSRRKIRKQSAAQTKTPDDARGETLYGYRHQTGTDWRQRP